jgi:hypothetical protein
LLCNANASESLTGAEFPFLAENPPVNDGKPHHLSKIVSIVVPIEHEVSHEVKRDASIEMSFDEINDRFKKIEVARASEAPEAQQARFLYIGKPRFFLTK